MNIPQGSPSYQAINPHLFRGQLMPPPLKPEKPPKRLRQRTKPLMNKLEQEWFGELRVYAMYPPYAQAMTFKLANGLRYTPDFFHFDWPAIGEANQPTAWEVKGPWATDDAIAKVKMFASLYKEIRVILVYKRDGAWVQERVLP